MVFGSAGTEQGKRKEALSMEPPIFTGTFGNCHIQGIAVDLKKGYIYYSFTTKLVKSDLKGNVVASVDGLMGHLGCIAFHPEDGCVYGSLEYKNDAIGKGILHALGKETQLEDAFYMAVFEVDRMDRLEMDAERDGIMTCVYLNEVARDYNGFGKNRAGERVPHRYGCSGIDGTAFGPLFGAGEDAKRYLFVAYGIYGDLTRDDNDHQVLLCYDTADLARWRQPLSQGSLHKSGPDAPAHKFFVYTGNTTYGVQNLEYDPYLQVYFMAVYAGEKPCFPNYKLYAADVKAAPRREKLCGLEEEGLLLRLAPLGKEDPATKIRGWDFPYGSTGLFAVGDGTYYLSEEHARESGQCSFIYRYTYREGKPFVLKN